MQMGWYWNMAPSRSMKRVFMEQAAATGELCRGLVSRWRRRDSPVRVRKRRGGGGGEGEAEGNRGGKGRGGGGEGEEKRGGKRELKGFHRPIHSIHNTTLSISYRTL